MGDYANKLRPRRLGWFFFLWFGVLLAIPVAIWVFGEHDPDWNYPEPYAMNMDQTTTPEHERWVTLHLWLPALSMVTWSVFFIIWGGIKLRDFWGAFSIIMGGIAWTLVALFALSFVNFLVSANQVVD
jgi:hypothetical protein